jgi:hypothetical protein
MHDIGLLIAQFPIELQELIINNKKFDFKGGIYENLFSMKINSFNNKAYYYGKTREFEIDFVLDKFKPVLIESKARNSIGISIIKKKKEHKHLPAYKLSNQNKMYI